MKRTALILALGCSAVSFASAQSLDDLNIQIHGYATQGFLYTNQNNIFTTSSTNGSPDWSEAVVNITSQPIPKLRIGVQGRYFLLGNLSNAISIDWAAGDYKFNDKFGVRFGKVKTPSGLFNEIQDIDPSYMWALLPQSVYPIGSRNSFLSHYGGIVYGILPLGEKLGKLEYRGWGGERVLSPDDGYFLPFKEAGLSLPNGAIWTIYGAAIHWKTPLRGLTVGASHIQNNQEQAAVTAGGGALTGTLKANWIDTPEYFAHYENGKWMIAFERVRFGGTAAFKFPGVPESYDKPNWYEWFGMATYKPTPKLSLGAYDSQVFDHQLPLGPARYSKDWTISSRYDFNGYLYAKAEQHFIEGTEQDFDATLNPNGLKPSTKLTVLKIGVSF